MVYLRGTPIAIKNVVVSDISGKEMENGDAVEIVVRVHPRIDSPKRLDALTEEVAGIKPVANLVELELKYADGTVTEVACTAAEFAKHVSDEVVENAPSTRGRRPGTRLA